MEKKREGKEKCGKGTQRDEKENQGKGRKIREGKQSETEGKQE